MSQAPSFRFCSREFCVVLRFRTYFPTSPEADETASGTLKAHQSDKLKNLYFI